MKKTVILIAAIVSITVITAFTSGGDKNNHSLKYSSGVQPGYSGDPAGGNKNCTSCHSGPAAQMETGWITSDIPEDGYVANTTYTITAQATRAGSSKFGFQVSPQNSSGTFIGSLINTGTETTLTSDPNYITHTSSGTSGSGFKTWTFDWTAPVSGSGEVTFYAAFNLANGNGSSSGDTIILSTLTVNESTVSVANISASGQSISVYPNPVNTLLNIETGLPGKYMIEITALNGRLMNMAAMEGKSCQIDMTRYSKGVYFVTIRSKEFVRTEKIIIK
ncbi:MAG TPA: T9SS type A sorting domain-containing protein [Bacteroides sp.]|nr:T9SS type A sorting domain-containing protein [Bacteroides sp.]